MTKVAVVLSGCGVFDGSEIHEAVSILVHLSRAGAHYDCFAPMIDQHQVMDHYHKRPVSGEKRNVLIESARIARGSIQPLDRLKVQDYDAVFFPGGFGAAKNLSDFATRGASCMVNAGVERVIREFHKAGKPVGMCCIAPVLAARALGTRSGGPGVRVTIGDDASTSGAIAAMGSTNVPTPVTEAFSDEANRLVTTPAYMYEAPVHEVYEGIGAMVASTLALIRSPAGARA